MKRHHPARSIRRKVAEFCTQETVLYTRVLSSSLICGVLQGQSLSRKSCAEHSRSLVTMLAIGDSCKASVDKSQRRGRKRVMPT